MKLKYKKMIILVSMCTMGIGLVTFSIVGPSSKHEAKSDESQVATYGIEDGTKDLVADDTQDTSSMERQVASGDKEELSDEKGIASASIDSSTNRLVKEDDALKKNEYKKINKLIGKYLNAKLSKDITKFEGIVNDTSLIDLTDIERQTNYIEDYSNIDVYTKKGPEDGSLIAYVYHEVKFTSIETLAPAMNAFYLKADENGDYHVYLGSVDNDTIDYIESVNNSDEVLELIYSVNDKMKQAADSDSALAEFHLKLEETANKVAQNN